MMMMRWTTVFVLVVLLAGCGPEKAVSPDTLKLKRPAAEVMDDCPDLPDVPKNDGNPKIRTKHYAEVRTMYADCRGEKRQLVQWIDKVAPK
jgi:hypothetical protein